MAAEVTDSIRTMDTLRWWEIHDKDSYTCPDCLRDPEEHPHQLEVHHVNKEPHKIVGLCAACQFTCRVTRSGVLPNRPKIMTECLVRLLFRINRAFVLPVVAIPVPSNDVFVWAVRTGTAVVFPAGHLLNHDCATATLFDID